MSEAATGARAAKAAQTGRSLKEAGRRVFSSHGFLEAKVADIAAEADRSVGSFYKHFASKEELLRSLLVDWAEEAGRQLQRDPAGDDLSESAALRARVAAYLRTYREHLPEIRALSEAALVDRSFAAEIAATREQQLQTLRAHLVRLQERGFELAGDPAVLAAAFSALVEGCCALWIGGADDSTTGGKVPTDTEIIDTLTALLANGLAWSPADRPIPGGEAPRLST